MIRNTLIIAGASFVLMLGCFAGVAALAGPVIMKEGWTIPIDHNDDGRRAHVDITGAKASPIVSRQLAWTGEVLTLDAPLDVTYVQGPTARIDIRGPKAYVDRLRIENGAIGLIHDNRDDFNADSLTIDRHGIRVHSNADQMKIVVTAPNISHFNLNGSGDLDIKAYDQPSMTVAINGSGDVAAEGKTRGLFVTTSGSGDADLAELPALTAEIGIAGSGNADIDASHTVQIAISGSGDVSLQRQPFSETSNISGSGSVRHNY